MNYNNCGSFYILYILSTIEAGMSNNKNDATKSKSIMTHFKAVEYQVDFS